MSKVRIESLSMSLDGFCAGPQQSLENPLGLGGPKLHDWAFPTATFQKMFGSDGGTTGTDNDYAARGFRNIGASILGRNMFGPIRGPWPNQDWKGWWGDNPPYHTDVFVLSHHKRDPIEMEGGTTFYFVTEGIHSALARAKQSAKGLDVRIGGGTATVRQFFNERLIDECHIAISPIILGSGESLFAGLDLLSLGYQCVEHAATANATHVVLKKT